VSFDDRMIHSLAIVRTPFVDTLAGRDEYGQPVRGTPVATTVRGLIQPKSAREMAQFNQAGATVSDHTIFMRPTNVIGADYIRFEPDDGRHFQIVGVRDAAGLGHHLEIDANLVTAGGS
jgi:head-tail adaptor